MPYTFLWPFMKPLYLSSNAWRSNWDEDGWKIPAAKGGQKVAQEKLKTCCNDERMTKDREEKIIWDELAEDITIEVTKHFAGRKEAEEEKGEQSGDEVTLLPQTIKAVETMKELFHSASSLMISL